MKESILEVKNLHFAYDEHHTVLDGISLSVFAGERIAILGSNGAGKSTFFLNLNGVLTPAEGEISYRGTKITRKTLKKLRQHIGIVFQDADNQIIASSVLAEVSFGPMNLKLPRSEVEERVNTALNYMNISQFKDRPPHYLSGGEKKRVSIADIIAMKSEIIIFDEPSAVLTPIEVDELLKTMKQLAKMGKSLIIITHKLHEVMEVADRVVVMRLGQVVAEKLKKDTSVEELSYLMVGRQIANRVIPEKETKEVLLEVKDLTLKGEHDKNILNKVNLHIKKGEIVGIAGVSGNGQSELIRCITGLEKVDGGKVTIDKKDITNKTVMNIREAGIAHIPEDRYMWGSAPEATLAENALMGFEDTKEFSKRGILNIQKVTSHAKELISKFLVKADSPSQKIKELSGGNAQKLIVAREMAMETPLIIACEPTRGIDIGAIEFIHDQLVAKRNSGDSVLLVSSELSEIMDLSDRIYVIYDGEIVGEFKRGSIDEKALGLLMVGGKNNEK